MRKNNRFKNFGYGFIGLVLMLVLIMSMNANLAKNVFAQAMDPTPEPPIEGLCAQLDCPDVKLNCAASDVKIAKLYTQEMIEPCRYAGDTGTYIFRAELIGTSQSRYDPTVWIAADGGDALTGSCWKDYLNPVDNSSFNLLGGYGPYRDLEANGDTCGDLSQNEMNVKYIGPVTITCTQEMLDTLSINTIIGWDNSVVNNCPANGGCPTVGSKCNDDPSSLEVNLNVVDLALEKTTVGSYLPGSDIVFNISITNKSAFSSTGYKVTDLLIDGLTYASSSLVDPNTCTSVGQDITCTIYEDLLPGASYSFTITASISPKFELDFGGFPFDNQACVKGNEYEHDGKDPQHPSTLADNCDIVNVSAPTAVDLLSFTADGSQKTIDLTWETANEVENMGFNLYRAASLTGTRIKLNDSLIPTLVPPGSLFGATYTYADSFKLSRLKTYYYWLESVDIYGGTTLHGPVSARLTNYLLLQTPQLFIKERP